MLLLRLLILGTLVFAGCTASPGPELVPGGNGVELQVPTDMATALRELDPSFEPFSEQDYEKDLPRWASESPNQALFAVIGDFNGDGIRDVVVDGHGADSTRRIALVSSERAVRAIQLSARALVPPESERLDDERGYWIYMRAVAPGRIDSPFEDGPLDLGNDAFSVVYFGKASTLYYWKDGAFRAYTTGD